MTTKPSRAQAAVITIILAVWVLGITVYYFRVQLLRMLELLGR